jgi:hypothetical protein
MVQKKTEHSFRVQASKASLRCSGKSRAVLLIIAFVCCAM